MKRRSLSLCLCWTTKKKSRFEKRVLYEACPEKSASHCHSSQTEKKKGKKKLEGQHNSNNMLPRPFSAAAAPSRPRFFSLDSRVRCASSRSRVVSTQRPSLARQRRQLRSSMAVLASLSSDDDGRSSSSSSSPAEISRGVPWPRRLLGGRIDDSEGRAKDVRERAGSDEAPERVSEMEIDRERAHVFSLITLFFFKKKKISALNPHSAPSPSTRSASAPPLPATPSRKTRRPACSCA